MLIPLKSGAYDEMPPRKEEEEVGKYLQSQKL